MTKQDFGEFARYFLIALAITIPIKFYVAQPFLVSGDSMTPTFADGEYLIVDELSYHLRAPERGEVVIFKYPLDPSKFFIERVIGLPNETVTITGSDVIITKEGGEVIEVKEPYIEDIGANTLTEKLESGEYFVMGDNRAASSDSRVWGPVPEDFMVGRVYVRLLPVKTLSFLPGHTDIE